MIWKQEINRLNYAVIKVTWQRGPRALLGEAVRDKQMSLEVAVMLLRVGGE